MGCKTKNCKCKPLRGPEGRIGPTGPVGNAGDNGMTGPTGPSLNSVLIFHSMQCEVIPTFDFGFYTSDRMGQATPFDPSTSNSFPANYLQTFLVPYNGVISDLSVRTDLRAIQNVNPGFTFTVYQSSSSFGFFQPVSNWVPTSLAVSMGPFSVNSNESITASAQTSSGIEIVSAGSLLVVVISSSGYNMFDIQPASFSVSYKYTIV